jgi:hypothetical protein
MSDVTTIRLWLFGLSFGVLALIMSAHYTHLLLGWVAEVIRLWATRLASFIKSRKA